LAAAISSPDHPVWKWLAKRRGRIAGLNLKLRLELLDDNATEGAGQLPDWMQPMQTLSGIPDVQLSLKVVDIIHRLNLPGVAQLLKQYAQIISHLSVGVEVNLLKRLLAAAAPCRSIDLTNWHESNELLDLADLHAVAGSLHRLTCKSDDVMHGSLTGVTALNSMSQLTAFHCDRVHFGSEEPWVVLAKLTSLQRLNMKVYASGDPSPLSTLTGLTYLNLRSFNIEADNQIPFGFSSLQPLSTLQQLEELHLGIHACAATSLQGLAGLSNLRLLELDNADNLSSLQGISPGVIALSLHRAPKLQCLAGIEGCTSMGKLTLYKCGVSSLQPLRGLSSMKELRVFGCSLTSTEGLGRMSLLQSLLLESCSSLTQLSGVQYLSALKSLHLVDCGVTSLQPLSHIGEQLEMLEVVECYDVQEEVLELPHVQPTADVVVLYSTVREVVLAGGLRRDGLNRVLL
jgi:Leucine-rich repeat (LRR) protein